MLLQEINNEFQEVIDIVHRKETNSRFYLFSICKLATNEFTINYMVAISDYIRNLSKIQVLLENKEFISKSVNNYVNFFVARVEGFCEKYDKVMETLISDDQAENKRALLKNQIQTFKEYAQVLYEWFIKIEFANEILISASHETWEPLPASLDVKCEEIIISSETKSTTLGDISKDIESLDGFMNNISFLINKDSEAIFFLRKVETGSLSVVISCITTVAPIITFLFFVIKLYQNTKKRDLNNKAKILELIDKELDIAKKILEIDPENAEVNEIVQKSVLYLLQYFKNNPKGTINGEKYDIGTEVLKIEEKKDE